MSSQVIWPNRQDGPENIFYTEIFLFCQTFIFFFKDFLYFSFSLLIVVFKHHAGVANRIICKLS